MTAAKASPERSKPVNFEAELLLMRKTRSLRPGTSSKRRNHGFPKSVALWCAQASSRASEAG